ncbi:MAG: hypothetical protein HY040_07665 [Planctomycetes bacterium]|nr:hypothetical protein [Planctomycetota bacterium]
MVLLIFAVTLFVSAFLLFLVQPLIGKMILPRLGGTAQVWSTCMLFFQLTLLLGYFYTHATSKLPLRRQMLLHCLLLIAPLVFLIPKGIAQDNPLSIEGWMPPPGANPIASTLVLLTLVVGLPFLVVSTSAPLLQKWFSHTGHPAAGDPYFLYGASNLGSLLSLVLYPFAVEPMMQLPTQSWVWTVAYIVLGLLIWVCALTVFKRGHVSLQADLIPAAPAAPVAPVAPAPAAPARAASKAIARAPMHLPNTDKVTGRRRLRWVLLAFAPSSLMLGVTSYVSVDLSPFPLLWVIPLALYLLSFILVFSKAPTPWIGRPHKFVVWAGVPGILAICFILLRGSFDPFVGTWVSFLGFFLVALVCHGELAKDRPPPVHLTDYFLWMSVGGALGGIFNGLLAPLLFAGVAEYPIAIAAACFLRPTPKRDGWLDQRLMKSLPKLEKWSVDTGDRLAQVFELPPPGSHWFLNVLLDLLFASCVFALTLWIRNNAVSAWGWFNNDPHQRNSLVSMLRTLGVAFDPRGAVEYREKLDRFLPLALLGPPLLVCAAVGFRRAMRFGLCVSALLVATRNDSGWEHGAGQAPVYAGRSYFGVMRVHEEIEFKLSDPEITNVANIGDKDINNHPNGLYTHLFHGTTDHGKNYHEPKVLRRLATTYFHRKGPVGAMMERWNWAPGPQNTYGADLRLPASIVGLGAVPLGTANLPVEQLTACWSEPPYAVIGLGTGIMASYGRCLQHVTFYEIDDLIRHFSLPPNDRFLLPDRDDPYFTYLIDAVRRGSNLEMVMGDARLSMAQERPEASALYAMPAAGNAWPSRERRLYSKHACAKPVFAKREHYYKVIVVDAFSSDAIPIHLITKEAFELYFSKLADDGVICVHTSNRHMDLVKPVVDIAHHLNKKWRVGMEFVGQARYLGQTVGSQHVMLANYETIKLADGKEFQLLPPDGDINRGHGSGLEWRTHTSSTPTHTYRLPPGMRLWTDDYSNIISILY